MLTLKLMAIVNLFLRYLNKICDFQKEKKIYHMHFDTSLASNIEFPLNFYCCYWFSNQ